MNRPLTAANTLIFLFFCLLLVGAWFGIAASAADKKNASAATKQSIAAPSHKTKNTDYEIIEWTDLLPDEDLYALENPPEYLSDIEDGSSDDQLTSQLQMQINKDLTSAAEDSYQQALVSHKIRPEYDGRRVRIPGFIVPLEFDDRQTVTTFFLVPFFGACIHVPPPPPNQIIYAEFEPGKRLEALYDPFWISGTLSTTLVENDMATAAYSINVSSIQPYEELPVSPVQPNDYKPDSRGRMPSGP